MKGPISKDIKIGFGLDGLEVATFFAGLLVVVGLLMESGPEAGMAIIRRIWPHREVTGNVLVTLGVFAEVAIGLFIARGAKRAQLQAEAQIAEITERASKAEERAALAEQSAAEANLARVKIEQQMRPRVLGDKEVKDLIDLLAPHRDTDVEIIVFDTHIPEPVKFSDQIYFLFVSAGFKEVRHWEARAGTQRIAGPSVIIAVAKGHEDEFRELAFALARALDAFGIDCGVGLGVFGRKGPNEQGLTKAYEFGAPQYHLRSEKPRRFMGIRAVSAFRVEVGAKQFTAISPDRPVTPPQA